MAEGLLAGVGNVDLFDQSTNQLIVSNKVLIDSAIEATISAEEARAGQGNFLLGKYFHDSAFNLTLTSQVWNLNYLALNFGGAIEASSDVMTIEQVTTGASGAITVSQTPVAFTSTSGIIGWWKKSTDDDTAYQKFTFTGKGATLSGVTTGTIVCIKYIITSASARKFKVNVDYIPAIVHAVMTVGLYKAGTTQQALTSSSKIGNILVDIPNFQLDGSVSLSLSSSSIASVPLSGSALATFGGSGGCSDHGYYAIITEDIFGADAFSNVDAIVIKDSSIDLATGETQQVEVYAHHTDGTSNSLVDPSLLTYVSATTATATVAQTGIVTAVASGSSILTVTVTAHTSLVAKGVITVS